MSEQDEFEIKVFDDFINLYVSPFCKTPIEGYTLDDMRHSFNAGIEGCAKQKDAIIAKQAAEIESLRNEYAKVNNEFGSETYAWPDAWVRVAELKQQSGDYYRLLVKQAAEIEALRGFAQAVIDGDLEYSNIHRLPKTYRLIDENGNHTPLLTGIHDGGYQ